MTSSLYWGKGIFSFFGVFFTRLFGLITGEVPFSEIAIDEMQIFVLVLLGISCSVIGSFLIVRKMMMIANSISHTILLGIVMTYVLVGFLTGSVAASIVMVSFPLLMLAALITSFVTVVFTEVLQKTFKLQADASIGIVFTFLFAVGIVLVTLFTRNSHIGIEVITGNIDMLGLSDLKITFYLCLGNVLLVALFYKEYLITAFDPLLSKMSRISYGFFTYLLLFQTSATIIGGMKAVGVVIVLSFLVVPVLTARMVTKSLPKMIVRSCVISCATSIVAVALSRHFLSVYGMAISTAGLSVACQVVIFSVVALFAMKKRVLRVFFKRAKIDFI